MAKPEPKKRKLKFNDLDAMIAEAESLHASGYTQHGSWSLGQNCFHVAEWARYPMDDFPVAPLPIRALLWMMKVTVGPAMKKKVMAEGFSGGMQTAPQSVGAEGMSDQEGIDKLKEIAERIKSFSGELKPSPLFGPMDKETHQKVTLLHAEHHLGYLEPKSQ